jgi:hypothetical protein
LGDLKDTALAADMAIKRANGRALVLNLGLAFGPPIVMMGPLMTDPSKAFQNPGQWITTVKEAYEDYATRGVLKDNEAQALFDHDMDTKAIEYLFGLDVAQNVFVIAAAGNDSCRPTWIAAPRFPAIVQGILGVGAISDTGHSMGFSNYDDNAPPPDGVGAFGEEIVGPYTQDTFPSGDPNNTGWAKWSGTSFAAPVASGLAACLLSENRPKNGLVADFVRIANHGMGGQPPHLRIKQG